MEMKTGTIVQVTEYGGNLLKRRVVSDLGKTVVVCNEAEYRRAKKEGRKPHGIGFPREAIAWR